MMRLVVIHECEEYEDCEESDSSRIPCILRILLYASKSSNLRKEHHIILPICFRALGTRGVESKNLLRCFPFGLNVRMHLLHPLTHVLVRTFKHFGEERSGGRNCSLSQSNCLNWNRMHQVPLRDAVRGPARVENELLACSMILEPAGISCIDRLLERDFVHVERPVVR